MIKKYFLEAIVAVDKCYGIAKNGKIPWTCKKDMQFFRSITSNNIVIMGSKTFFSLPNSKPLVNRFNVVLTKTPEKYNNQENLLFVNQYNLFKFITNPLSFDLLQKYKFLNKNFIMFVIGGNEIYTMLLPYCRKLWLTQINGDYNCDTFLTANINHFKNNNIEYCDDELSIIEMI
jgi:dihydrofolate reductase